MTLTTTTEGTTPKTDETITADEAADAEAQRALDDEAERLARAANLRFNGDREKQLLNRCKLVSEACGCDPRTGAPYYTPSEVLGWLARAVEMGCETPVLGPAQIKRLFRLEIVPNAKLRERFEYLAEEEGLSANELARRLGITKKPSGKRAKRSSAGKRVPDASAVERMLGITPNNEGGVKRLRLFVAYEQAVALADELDIPYHDLGI